MSGTVLNLLEEVSRRTITFTVLPLFEAGGHLDWRSAAAYGDFSLAQLTDDGDQQNRVNLILYCPIPNLVKKCRFQLETNCRKIEEIQLGDIMAHVAVRVGDNLIESAIADVARTNSSSRGAIP
jgi:hypothetical protein